MLREVQGCSREDPLDSCKQGTLEKPQVRCRLVAQELALGERPDELFAATLSVSAVRFSTSSLEAVWALHHDDGCKGSICMELCAETCASSYHDVTH